jgi:anti-sigma B factor antagonist
MSQAFRVTLDDADPRRFRLSGELDLSGVEVLLSAVEHAAATDGGLVFDLSELTFVDSSGISAFVRMARQADGGALVLEAPLPQVQRVLDLVGLGGVPNLEIRAS